MNVSSSKQFAEIRRYPYPYKALIAFSTDLDGTRSASDYFELLRYWNSDEETTLGDGLSLQLANSIYFGMPATQFSYWNASGGQRKILLDCMEAGLIDTLHTYGDLVVDSKSIDLCIQEMADKSMSFPIWSNHSNSPTNIDCLRKTSSSSGDDPNSALYHTDRTLEFGIRYGILGQASAILGQETRVNPFRAAEWSLPSVTTAIRQSLKIASAPALRRYRRHARNRILQRVFLKDGQSICEVMRANWHPHGIRYGCDGRRIHEVITPRFLKRLSESNGAAIVYTHLNGMFRLPVPERIQQLRMLAPLGSHLRSYGILCLTSADFLDYLNVSQNLDICAKKIGARTHVDLSTSRVPMPRRSVQATILRCGLTLTIGSNERPILTVNGRPPSERLDIDRESPSTWRVQFPLKRREIPPSIRNAPRFEMMRQEPVYAKPSINRMT